jgi:hypothetical protein
MVKARAAAKAAIEKIAEGHSEVLNVKSADAHATHQVAGRIGVATSSADAVQLGAGAL